MALLSTCRVVRGQQAHAVVVAKGGSQEHGRDSGGIQSGLHLVRGAVVEQRGDAHGFSCMVPCDNRRADGTLLRSRREKVGQLGGLPAAAARCSAVRPSLSTAFATYCAQPPRASSRSVTASSRPAAAAACRGNLFAAQHQTEHGTGKHSSLKSLEFFPGTHRLAALCLRNRALLPNEGE